MIAPSDSYMHELVCSQFRYPDTYLSYDASTWCKCKNIINGQVYTKR